MLLHTRTYFSLPTEDYFYIDEIILCCSRYFAGKEHTFVIIIFYDVTAFNSSLLAPTNTTWDASESILLPFLTLNKMQYSKQIDKLSVE
jgi:hypothetical protein